MAWAEDRAPGRHDPSAVPGAKTEGGAARCRPVFPFRDWHEGGKSLPSDQACSLPYLPTPVSPFHAEPTHPDASGASWHSGPRVSKLRGSIRALIGLTI